MIDYQPNKISNMFFIIGFVLLIFLSSKTYSQNQSILDTKLSYKAKNKSIHNALVEIGDIVGYEFSYNSDLIPANNRIKVNQTDISLEKLLYQLIDDSTLTYKVLDKQIVICKRNQLEKLVLTNHFTGSKQIISIKGKIFDKETEEGLGYANISIFGTSIGTVSNEQGEFVIKIPNDFINDTLVISYIGYKNSYIPIRQLSTFNNIIYLEQSNLLLKEVIIRTNDAKYILEKAIENIRDNYYTDPYQIVAFYREMVKNNDEIEAITEAVLEVYKSPYLGLYSDQIKLVKGRKNEYYTLDDTVSLKLKGGLYASLYLDLIKNPSSFLIDEYFDYYQYYIEEIVNYDNNTAYVIDFKPKVYLEEHSFQGKIYVNTESLSILAVDFSIAPDAMNRIRRDLVVKKAFGTRVKPTSVKYLINYRRINGKYYLNLVRGELDFKVKYRKKLFSKDFKTIFEFASNNIDTVNVKRYKRAETIPTQNIFIDENYQYDDKFWGDYNYISPEESLEDALIRIQKRLENINQE